MDGRPGIKNEQALCGPLAMGLYWKHKRKTSDYDLVVLGKGILVAHRDSVKTKNANAQLLVDAMTPPTAQDYDPNRLMQNRQIANHEPVGLKWV